MTAAYITRTLCIEPHHAEEAMAECQQGTFHAAPVRGRPRARLCLAREPDADSQDPLQLFARRGTMWVGLWPVRVHLECNKWSESKSELGLRPSTMRWPVGTEGYARAALALLKEVAQALVASRQIETQQSTSPYLRIRAWQRHVVGAERSVFRSVSTAATPPR